jgi:hypothetical protein
MTDIRDRLREADPLLTDPALPPEDVAVMRRRVLDAARGPRPAAVDWKRTLAFAAAIAVIAGAGIDTARRTSRATNAPDPAAVTPAATGTTRTQLHFSTPGGTRIIWTIDPAFHLTEKR